MGASGRAEVEGRLKRLLNDDLGVNAALIASVDRTTPLVGHGIGLDSIELMALALSIEREFDMQIPDEDMTVERFKDIGTLTDYILQMTK